MAALALTGMAQWSGCHLADGKVTGSIPGPGTGRPGSQLGMLQ